MLKLFPAPGPDLSSWCCQCLLGTESSSPWFWLHLPRSRPWQLVLAVPRTSEALAYGDLLARPQCASPDHPHGWDPILLQDLPEHLPIHRIKGFSKFTKNSCSPVFHSKVYSTIIASEVVWSQQYFLLRNPACLSRLPACLVCLQENPSSFLENSYAKNFNLLATETSKMPRQLSHRDRTPLLESLPLRSTNFKNHMMSCYIFSSIP